MKKKKKKKGIIMIKKKCWKMINDTEKAEDVINICKETTCFQLAA